jgi:exonuclease VII large subunit
MTFEEMQQILAAMQREFQNENRELRQTQRQTESTMQALSRDVAQLVATQQQSMRNMEDLMQRLGDVQIGMARWMTSMDENQPTILARLMRIENKVDTLIDRNEPSQ